MFESISDNTRSHLTETHLQALLDFAVSQSPSMFYIGSLTGDRSPRFVRANVAAITGPSPAAFLDSPGFGVRQIHPEDRLTYDRAVADLRVKGVRTQEYRFATAAGDFLWIRDEMRLIQSADGSDEMVGCMSDITEEKNARSQLARSDAEYRRIAQLFEDAVHSLPNGFSIYDAEGKLTLANRSLAIMIGGETDPDALVGLSRSDIIERILPLLRSFDGHQVSDTPEWNRKATDRLNNLSNDSVELEYEGGNWRLVSSHPTSEGGQVVFGTDITHLKKAESTIRESEEQFRSIIRANPSPVRVSVFGSWEVLYESPAASALFGEPRPFEKGRTTTGSYADKKARDDVIQTLRTRRRIDNREIQMKRKDGTTFWASLSSHVITFKGEDVCVTNFTDLTEAKDRERELRLAHETLEDAIEALSDGFVLYNADNRLVTCNTQYRTFNQGCEDLLVPGAYWPDVTRARAERGFFTRAKGNLEEWLQGEMDKRGIAAHEEFPASDGRWFEYSHRPTRQGGFVSTWRDVTNRKQMENSLRDNEALVRQVLEACPVPITMNRVDDGTIIYECPAAHELLGYPERQEGKSVVSRWVNREDRERYLKRLRETGVVDGLETRFYKVNGEEFPCALSSRLIDYQGEQVIVSNLFDLTDRKAAEAELAQQREMLHQSEKLSALGELLAGVSHELNNPLSVLVGQAQMLKETSEDERTILRAEKIGKAADRCARIVKTFLAMARHEPTETIPVDINAVIEESLDVTVYGLRTSGIDLSLRLAKNPPMIPGDPDQLRQVIINLIINAQHALLNAPGIRQLRISTSYRKGTDRIVLKVKDSGPGVSKEIRGRIFEPLYTTKEVGTGTGMGLALCHRIVEAHGGTIDLEPGLGEGACFAIRLPRTLNKRPPTSRPESCEISTGEYRVLVVDDEYDVGEIISDVLQNDGHAVEVAASGKTALEKLKRQHYDVILSDIRMPGMDGPAFYRALSEANPQLINGLAFITGDTLSPHVQEFLDASERPYLEKPLLPRDIRDLVELVIRRQHE